MKYADKLVGKGLSFWVITKLITYNLAWMVVLVVPMAALISTLMAFGGMAQNNEVAIFKSTGISLYKMMLPVVIASFVICALLMEFNNNIYPDANHAARLLIQDIKRKKPTLSLVEGVFSSELYPYSILARKINSETGQMREVVIYDDSNPSSKNVVTAKTGKIYFSGDQSKLIIDLQNGEIHETSLREPEEYRKLIFEKHRIQMNAEQFNFQQTVPGDNTSRGDRELGASEMLVKIDTMESQQARYKTDLLNTIYENFDPGEFTKPPEERYRKTKYKHALLRVENRISTANHNVLNKIRRVDERKKQINNYYVEVHKKFALPVAAIIFVLIGAPLGTMIRKGGVGVAAGVSLLFFIIYWAFLVGGEKLADRALLSPAIGAWSANVILGLTGIYFTILSARERISLSFNFTFFKKLFRKSEPMTNENN